MNRILVSILTALALVGCRQSETTSPKAQFVLVRVPEQIRPVERGEKYEDPLEAVLKREGVGEVNGGGTQLSAPDANGKKSIEWVGVDVELSNFEKGMPILKRELLRLGAPPETILVYKRNGKDLEKRLR